MWIAGHRSATVSIALPILCYVWASQSLAGPDLTIDPLRVTLSVKARAAQLEIGNAGNEPDLLQSQVSAWGRKGCVDILEPSQSVVISPPIFTVQPTSKQIVRVLLSDPPESSQEVTLRVILTEISPPTPSAGRVATRLAVSLPVFVLPRTPAAPRIEWNIARTAGKLEVTAHNVGSAHTRLRSLKLVARDGASLLDEEHTDYLLAGDSCHWSLPTGDLRPGTRFIAVTEEREVTMPVPES